MTERMPSPAQRMLDILNGPRVFWAVQTALQLGIADLLKEGPKPVRVLAAATATNEGALYRLLRALSGVGLFEEIEPQSFAQTPLSDLLRSDHPLHSLIAMNGELWLTRSWEGLPYSIRTGESAFQLNGYRNLWDFFQHQDTSGQWRRSFNAGMTGLSSQVNRAIVQAYNFSAFGTLADIGGGQGTLLAMILAEHPALHGILFDHQEAIVGAKETLSAEILARCKLVPGDFLREVPQGADAYLLKQVLHNWNDEQAILILQNCRQAMKDKGRILIVDRLLQPGNADPLGQFMDLQMLLHFQGAERTERQLAALFEAAGFNLLQVYPTRAPIPLCIAEGVAV